ncbi:MAG: patatin-like phospholipase family protein [Prevotella sp.]|nr:patatin-like phospholipase family protein [Prevotella sp.]
MAFTTAEAQTTNRPKIGLALGGGGAKGAAEIGVLKVIEECGIPIDYIAGTSIGSIVGGLYAVGYRSADLDHLFRSQEWLSLLTDRKSDLKNVPLSEEDGVTYIFGFPVSRKKRKEGERPMIGMLNGDQIVTVLDSMMHRSGYIQFDTLPIPFRCVAVDISGPEEVVLKEGELAKAMRASMAIPGAFKAVEWGDKSLVDGGMMNNLPVDVVRAMGADIVIAIDLSNEQHESRDFSLKDLVGIGGILDWAVSRPDWKKHNDNRADADVLITPNLEGYDVMSFSLESISDMIARGERAARQVKPQLMKLKQ